LPDVPKALTHHIETNRLGETLVPCFGVDQGDAEALRAILAREFGDEPIDAVIDDASHPYGPTKASFNVLFPRLRTGGAYFLEDWGWAHWRGAWQSQWLGEPALTNLVFEASMNVATWGGYMISRVDVQHGFVTIGRGGGRLPTRFDVSSLYLSRGRPLEPI